VTKQDFNTFGISKLDDLVAVSNPIEAAARSDDEQSVVDDELSNDG
jgi:hypothetical protein